MTEPFYDVLRLPDGSAMPLKVRSMVGLIPLLAVTAIDADTMARMPAFARRMNWFLRRKPHLSGNVARIDEMTDRRRHLATILEEGRLRLVLRQLLDEKEFLSPYGIRSLSRQHRSQPFEARIDGQPFRVDYEPAESTSGMFGGNSNWRGPVWFPINFLLIEALDRFHPYYGDGRAQGRSVDFLTVPAVSGSFGPCPSPVRSPPIRSADEPTQWTRTPAVE